MYYFPLIIGSEDAAADGHSYHMHTLIQLHSFVFSSYFIMNCCTCNKVFRSIVDDMYLVNVTNVTGFWKTVPNHTTTEIHSIA